MSVTRPIDGWDRNASSLLRRRLFEGSPDKSVSYAPDFRYGIGPGPLTVQIAEILRRHADLWAYDRRRDERPQRDDGRESWLLQMRLADAEIKRLVAGHTLGHGAAA